MIIKIKDKIRRYFGFSANETRGLFVLLPLILIILILPSVIRTILDEQDHQRIEQDKKILAEWLEQSKKSLKKVDDNISLDISPFDPNQITEDQWKALGFKEHIAKRIIKFRNKGGKFTKKEDLLKIYGIDKKLTASYFDFLIFPEPNIYTQSKKQQKSVYKKQAQQVKFEIVKTDLNLADTSQLRKIRGIGPVLSSRIVNYRRLLGGFHNIEQLGEVYGVKPALMEKLKERFVIGPIALTKININEDSIKVLARHPYLSYKVSRALVKYRTQHGDYQSIEEIKNIHIISDSLFQKISIYLKTSSIE